MLNLACDGSDFSYEAVSDSAGLRARAAIYAGDAGLRQQIAEDLDGAGFRTIDGGTIAALLEGPIALLGDVVVVDCPVTGTRGLDGLMLAGLARLDMRVARAGAKLIVATNMAGLDDVFAVLDQSNPQILVAPSRAERVIAVGRAMGEAGAARLREMGEEDRVALLRLSQQVEAIAHSLDRLSQPEVSGATSLSEFKRDYRGADPVPTGFGGAGLQLPDPGMVRQVIANRQARCKFFDAELFGDPAWDMLLDLTAAHAEGARVSVTSLCIAAAVPATTALRWLTQMVESGVFVRLPDPADKRRAFIALSDRSLAAMAGYFASLRAPATLAA
ncbi:MarR family transcriptional regulator [Erythrobacter sp. NFXS35]|uniref:MarR family transcriptional regulator n=1 Tax=Erythrobacter sp. NFXS35 TaxID=2818436 RepID=UPI0032DEB0F2